MNLNIDKVNALFKIYEKDRDRLNENIFRIALLMVLAKNKECSDIYSAGVCDATDILIGIKHNQVEPSLN